MLMRPISCEHTKSNTKFKMISQHMNRVCVQASTDMDDDGRAVLLAPMDPLVKSNYDKPSSIESLISRRTRHSCSAFQQRNNSTSHRCDTKLFAAAPSSLLSILMLSYSVLLLLTCVPHPADGQFGSRFQDNLISRDPIQQEPTYFVVSSRTVRPGQVYRVWVSIMRSQLAVSVSASIQRNGVELASAAAEVRSDLPETLLLRIPPTSISGSYKLRVEGRLSGTLGGAAFINETTLDFSQRSMTIFVTTDKPIYRQGQKVRFRAVPITTDLKAFPDAIDVFMLDPNMVIMRRWLSRQSNLGAVSLTYPLSEQPVYGNWTIKVVAQGQEEYKTFLVEEYYQTRFEVNVSMPAFFLDTDKYVSGSIMANFTNGIPVSGNLTIYATIEPAMSGSRQQFNYDRPPAIEINSRLVNGYSQFEFETNALAKLIGGGSNLDGAKVSVRADVGEPFLNLKYSGFARAYLFSSRIKLIFLGSPLQVFKPAMPFKSYVAISYHDGSPLDWGTLAVNNKLEVQPRVTFYRGASRALASRTVEMSPSQAGTWEINLNLLAEMGSNNKRVIRDVSSLIMDVYYEDQNGVRIKSQLTAYATYAPSDRLLQVSTSTSSPRVGEYIVLHVRANYFVESFSYIILSKGIILFAGREEMTSMIKTFTVSLSAEMSPSATIVVYDIVSHTNGGEVVADSLSFPVDGISPRSNFSISVNTKKDKMAEKIEVVVRGEPGTYVGLSALDYDLVPLQSDSQINHAHVRRKMSSFDDPNSTYSHVWVSRDGKMDSYLHFPTPSHGLDANRTFDLAGLIVITDANVTRRPDSCNDTRGYRSCFDGGCYHYSLQCDGKQDCRDGTDELHCNRKDIDPLAEFRLQRTNRLERLYEAPWLWRDVNIGPLGYFIFSVRVPKRPATWVISGFGISAEYGFNVASKPVMLTSVRPFFAVVEMPSLCNLGEQIGVRVGLFNNMPHEIEVLLVLERSEDYKFVHVEPLGVVSSYSPRTSTGEHQHLVLLKAQSTKTVYIPMVATRLGLVNVSIVAKTQVSSERIVNTLQVEPDGIAQYTHTACVLDLSQGAYLIKYLDTNVTESPIIPYRQERRYIYGSNRATISVVGDVVGPAFPFMPVNTTSLLRQPFGCGEQNMFNFAYNMFTVLYLRLTGQRSSRLEREAFNHLNVMYQRQLSYQNLDGSFHLFRFNRRPSVWLTAFCARIFHRATFQEWENFLFIDPSVIRNAVSSVLDHQTEEGSFLEADGYVYDRKMNQSSPSTKYNYNTNANNLNTNAYEGMSYNPYGTSVGSPMSNISLTAHCLIMLTTVRDLSGELGSRVANGRARAQAYLERALHFIKDYEDPYPLTIVSYALTLANSVDAHEAFNLLYEKKRETSGMYYWSRDAVPPPKTQIENNRPFLLPRLRSAWDASAVEATAYALLVHVQKQAVIQKEIVEWLNYQRQYDGGWASTQDSIIALEALIEYSVQSRLRDVTDIRVTVEVPSIAGFEKRLHIGGDQIALRQAFDLPQAWGAIVVKAQGSGVALVQLDVQYNVDWPHLQIPPPIESFDLEVAGNYYGRNSSHITMKACARWKLLSESIESGMTVLEATLPTGYWIQQQDLDTYVRSSMVANLKEARFDEKKVTFYFDHMSSRFTCVTFTAQRWYPVANLTRYISFKVYDYYAPERFNESMVNVFNLYTLSICHVCGSYQCPYCPVFSPASNLRCPPLWLFALLALIVTSFYSQFTPSTRSSAHRLRVAHPIT